MWSSQGSLINRIDHLLLISLIWFSHRLPNRHMSFAYIRELLSERSRSNQCMENPSLQISRFMPCVQHHACVWACLFVSVRGEMEQGEWMQIGKCCFVFTDLHHKLCPIRVGFCSPSIFTLFHMLGIAFSNHLIKFWLGLLFPNRRTESKKKKKDMMNLNSFSWLSLMDSIKLI